MKKIRIITSFVLAVCLILSLSGCGEIQKAESTVKGMFEAFKNLDFEEAQKYVNVGDITSVSDEASVNVEKIIETVFGSLDYEIVSSEKVDDHVVVKTKITAIDMKPVMSDFFSKALEYALSNAFSSSQPTEEETTAKMEEILVECLSKSDLTTVTNEVYIKVVKNEDKKWEVEAEDDFVNAVLGGLMDAVEEMSNAFNSAAE